MGTAVVEPISPELVLVDLDFRARVLAGERYESVTREHRPTPHLRELLAQVDEFEIRRGRSDGSSRRHSRSWLVRSSGVGFALGAIIGVLLSTLTAPPRAAALDSLPLPRTVPVAPKWVLPIAVEAPRPPDARRQWSIAMEAPRPPDARPRRPVAADHGRAPAKAAAPRPAVAEVEPASNMLGRLPDPTPPTLRLAPTSARALLEVSGRFRLDWATLLAATRSRDASGWQRAKPSELRWVARRLVRGRDLTPDQAALARYYRAVGLDALVSGLAAARSVLAARVLRDPRIQIYPAGRGDVAAGLVDVRVLVLLLYLARSEGSVAASSLVSGHAPPGNGSEPSAHNFGAAVDLRAVAGHSVYGRQQPGGPVARAILDMLQLPPEVKPREILSLLAMGGPTLALADHDRAVHVGFDPTVSAHGSLELLWRTAGTAYDVPWQLLGAINEIETANGTFLHVSPAGAVGWMQFMPSTWQRYGLDADGNGAADPWNPTDAVFAAARYLTAAGVQADPPAAVWAYNHAGWYVQDVLARARRIEQAG